MKQASNFRFVIAAAEILQVQWMQKESDSQGIHLIRRNTRDDVSGKSSYCDAEELDVLSVNVDTRRVREVGSDEIEP
jgi:hypothetical protein